METRSIAIGLVAVVAAFAAAFGVAKSGGSKTETAGAGVKATTIKVAAPPAVAGVEVGGTLPALKAERKKAKKKAKKKAASSPSTTNTSSSPSTQSQESAPSTQNSAPSTQNTAPSTQNSAPAPQVSNPSPPASRPAPSNNNAPISGGGEDG